MKLYIITIDEIYKLETMSHQPIVCLTKADAAKELQQIQKDNWPDYKEAFGCEARKEYTRGKSFEMWLDGEYADTHYAATVNEIEVTGVTLSGKRTTAESYRTKSGHTVAEYASMVSSVIADLELRMRDGGLTMVTLPSGSHDRKVFIVNMETGNADPVMAISTNPEGGISLHCRGQVTYHFKDYDSQDNHTIADPLMLNTIANTALDKILSPIRAKSNRKEDLVQAIAGWLGKEGSCPFEHGFANPEHPKGKISEVRPDCILVQNGSEHLTLPLEKQPVKVLKSLIESLNAYANYVRKEA